jgi:ABC-2 type transport system permease protein
MRPDTLAWRVLGRPAMWSGTIWGSIFGTYVIASASGYAATYPSVTSRLKLAVTFAGNTGIAAMLGPARQLQTVAGFTAWRTMGVLTVVGAVWGLFLATRLMRGEEEGGRAEIMLAGPTTRSRVAGDALIGLFVALVSLWSVTAMCALADGATSKVRFPVAGSLALTTSLAAGATMFLGIGALLSQMAATRRQANTIGAVLIGAAYVTRMVADAASIGWLRWVTPLGWTEELHPLTGFRPAVLVPIVALAVVAGGAAVAIAGRRDLGASLLPTNDSPAPRTSLLTGPTGLAVRLSQGVITGWTTGMILFGLVLGLVAQSAASALTGSATLQRALARLGGHRSGAETYLGFALVIGAAVVAFLAAAQVTAARTEEAQGHLDHVFARPVSRPTWLVGRIGVSAALIVGVSVLMGVAAWVGAASQNTGVGFGVLVQAGLNVATPALFALGLGALVYAAVPRHVAVVMYGIVAWSLLLDLIASVVKTNHFLLDTSILSHIAPVPAANANWGEAGLLVVLGAGLAGVGVLVFTRRDLAGE